MRFARRRRRAIARWRDQRSGSKRHRGAARTRNRAATASDVPAGDTLKHIKAGTAIGEKVRRHILVRRHGRRGCCRPAPTRGTCDARCALHKDTADDRFAQQAREAVQLPEAVPTAAIWLGGQELRAEFAARYSVATRSACCRARCIAASGLYVVEVLGTVYPAWSGFETVKGAVMMSCNKTPMSPLYDSTFRCSAGEAHIEGVVIDGADTIGAVRRHTQTTPGISRCRALCLCLRPRRIFSSAIGIGDVSRQTDAFAVKITSMLVIFFWSHSPRSD